jgi:hypothetical protein
MATPTTSIDALPSRGTPDGDDLVIIQDSGVTKKATVAALMTLAVGTPGPVGPAGPPGLVVQGLLSGTDTPLPAGPSVGDLWIVGTPVPDAAPDYGTGTGGGGGTGTAPGAPISVVVVPGDTEATVFWAAPGADGGSPITGYDVQRSLTTDPTDFVTVASVGPAVLSNKSVGLTNGTSYYFRIIAINVNGGGLPSSVASGIPVPGSPTVDDPAWQAVFDTNNLATIESWYVANTGHLAESFNPLDLWTVGGDPLAQVMIDDAWLAANEAADRVVDDGGGHWTVTGLHCRTLGVKRSNVTCLHCFVDRKGLANWNGVTLHDPITGSANSVTNTNVKMRYCTVKGGSSWKVTNKALTSNVATLTIGTHNITVGMQIEPRLNPPDAAFHPVPADGTRFTVTAVTGTTVSYARTHANVASTATQGRLSISGPTDFGDVQGHDPAITVADQLIWEYCDCSEFRAGFLSVHGVTARYNYVHDLDFYGADPHNTSGSIRGQHCTFQRNCLIDGTSSCVSLYADTTPYTNFAVIENTFSVDPEWAVYEINFPNRAPGFYNVLSPGYSRILRGNKFERGTASDLQYFSEVSGNKKLGSGEDLFGDGTPVGDRLTGIPCTLTGFSSGFPGYAANIDQIRTWPFVPDSGSMLLMLHAVRNGGHTTVPSRTVVDSSGQTWSLVPGAIRSEVGDSGDTTHPLSAAVYTLDTSVVSDWRTVNVDAFAGSEAGPQSMYVFEIPGFVGKTLAKAAVVSGNHSTSFGVPIDTLASGNLASAATPGHYVCAFFATQHDGAPGGVTAPAGWHLLGNMPDNIVTTGMLWRNDFNGTNVTITDLGASVSSAVMILCEFTP